MRSTRRLMPALLPARSRPFPPAARGSWLMLAGAFAAFALSVGVMQSYTVFLIVFVQAFGWSRAETSIPYSLSQLVMGATSPLVGALVDRLGPRRLVLLGGGLMTLGLLATATVTDLWHVILSYGIVTTLGANCLGLVVFVPLLSRRFVRRRGTAIAIVQSANGIGRAAAMPAAAFVVSLVGWRASYLVQAALVAALALPLAAFFRGAERPAAPAADEAAAPAPAAPSGWTLGEAVATPHFWLLSAVYLFTGLGSFIVSLHQLAFAVGQGFDKLYAAEVLGTGAFLSTFGIILTGALSDWLGREVSAVLAYGVSIAGVVCALFISGPQQGWLLWLHACLFGLTWGARGPAITAKTADLFPGPRLGTILGVITLGSGLGAAGGSWAAGFVFDLSGSYRAAFLLSIAFYACGVAAFWALRRPPDRRARRAGAVG
jgi:MFS family permease